MKQNLLKISLTLAILSGVAEFASGQAIWVDAGASKTWLKKYSVGIDAQYRTTDRINGTDRWSIGAGVSWKPLKWLKAGADYNFIYNHRPERVTNKGNIVEAYWQPRHRVGVDVTGSVKYSQFEFSLRERWQYTRHQGVNAKKYDPSGVDKGWEYITPKDRHVLRSRLKVEWGIKKKCPFTPYLSGELYNSLNNGFSANETRYTVGCDYKIDRHNKIGLYYRFIDSYEAGEKNRNIIGVEYSFKL